MSASKERQVIVFCIFLVVVGQFYIAQNVQSSNINKDSGVGLVPVSRTQVVHPLRTTLRVDPVRLSTVMSSTQGRVLCSHVRKNLVGRIAVVQEPMPFESLEKQHTELKPGGKWAPSDCVVNERVAVIVPYRDREEHLKVFLRHMHPFLQHQNISYAIYVIELAKPVTFNRGLVLNVGFQEALKVEEYDCFIFHDVDQLPEDDRNLYQCEHLPRHMAVSVSKENYTEFKWHLFGGVEAIRKNMFLLVNGFSNKFFGWGGEDDDLANRFRELGMNATRWSVNISRYTSLNHESAHESPHRFVMLGRNKRRRKANMTEGLSTLVYQIVKRRVHHLYTYICVKTMYRRYVVEGKYYNPAKNDNANLKLATNDSGKLKRASNDNGMLKLARNDDKLKLERIDSGKSKLARNASGKLELARNDSGKLKLARNDSGKLKLS